MKAILICSDENKNAGERDYAIALCGALKAKGADITCYKISRSDATKTGALGAYVDAPMNNPEYERLRPFHAATALAQIGKDTIVIGAGHSTLPELTALHDASKAARFSFVTHMIEADQEAALAARPSIRIFTPAKAPGLANVTALPAVPHTTTAAKLAYDAAYFMENAANGKTVRAIVQSGMPYASVVLNAGFEVAQGESKVYVPYRVDEARAHGYALGAYMPSETALILLDGGPRNVRDRNEMGEQTHKAFMQGYNDAQERFYAVKPLTLHEAFTPGLPYNSLYAMLHLAQHENCLAFISNAEGYGTMDAALRFVDNGTRLRGLFPFDANARDATGQRLANIADYNRRGIAILTPDAAQGLRISVHPDGLKGTRNDADPAAIIADVLFPTPRPDHAQDCAPNRADGPQ